MRPVSSSSMRPAGPASRGLIRDSRGMTACPQAVMGAALSVPRRITRLPATASTEACDLLRGFLAPWFGACGTLPARQCEVMDSGRWPWRLVGIRRSTVKGHLAVLRARSGLTAEQLIYAERASGRLVVPSLDPHWAPGMAPQKPPLSHRKPPLSRRTDPAVRTSRAGNGSD